MLIKAHSIAPGHRRTPVSAQRQASPPLGGQRDTFSSSSSGAEVGYKIAGAAMIMAAIPVGVISGKFAAGALVGLAGLGMMFGPDM